MKKTINFYDFRNWFKQYRPNNFSESGLQALWEMLEEYEDSTGKEIEFDPIALCCEYTEYEDMEEFWKDYDKEDYPNEQSIMDATFYWAFGDSFIIQQF
jgi:glycerophosphoryl diester phosphodiesterase